MDVREEGCCQKEKSVDRLKWETYSWYRKAAGEKLYCCCHNNNNDVCLMFA